MRYSIPLLVAAVLVVGGGIISCMAPKPSAEVHPPNVVVILVDTLRPGFLNFYGYEQETAPFLTHLSKSSTVFDRALSTSSWTAPATASVFTSLYPYQHGVVQGFYAHRDAMFAAEQQGIPRIPLNAIADGVTTMPEMFKAAGYATFGVAANRNIDKELGFKQGFDHFFEQNEVPAERVYKEVRGWRGDISKTKPYFLYVHLMDPHYPYGKVSPYFERYRTLAADDNKARYLSELRHADQWIERLYKLLRMDRNTLVVFLSDHGEEFMDHGSTQHGPTLYEELQHVLMMVYGPGVGVTPHRVGTNVSQIDVLPTLAEFIHAPVPHQAQGVSLWPLLRGEQTGEEPAWAGRTLMAHRIVSTPPYNENWAAIHGAWKYIEHYGRAPELYDHRTDPAEKHDVAAEHADIAQKLAHAVEAARIGPREFTGEQVLVPIDKQLQEELKSIGYN